MLFNRILLTFYLNNVLIDIFSQPCSSYGQNLRTSTYIGETVFCIVLCIGGLILFARLIGNMQVKVAA